MPCDIGYKTYVPIRIPVPKPQILKKKLPSPKVDQDLLDKLGVDDPQFLAWMQGLNIKLFLEKALERALNSFSSLPKVKFSITEDGSILIEGSFKTESQKAEAEKEASIIANRWQMEVLKIVTQLLDYDAVIKIQPGDNGENLTLVAEEAGKTHPCKYIRVSKKADGNGEITFEHFASKDELGKEKVKFAALSQKLGVKIVLPDSPVSGQPIPSGTEEKYPQRNKQ